MKNFVAAHEFDHEATFVYDTKSQRQDKDTDVDCVVFGPELPVTPDVRRNLARLVAYCLNKDLKAVFPLTIERVYSDYDPQGEQTTPSYTLVKYYSTAQDRDDARKHALKLTQKLTFLPDEVFVHKDEQMVLVPVSANVELGGVFYTEFLEPLVEGGGEDWEMCRDKLGFGSLRVGDELGFNDLKEYCYVSGMETWEGKAVADMVNKTNDTQIEYLEDSVWRVTKA